MLLRRRTLQIKRCSFCDLDLVIDDGIRIPYEDPDGFSDP